MRGIAFGSITPEQRRQAQWAALRTAASLGIAAVHECGGPGTSDESDFTGLLALGGATQHQPEVYGYWGELMGAAKAQELGAVGAGGDVYADGALGSQTAHLRESYLDSPSNCGHGYLTAEQVEAHVVDCIRTDGDEGLFASYSDVQFRAPIRAGDVLEVAARGHPGRHPQPDASSSSAGSSAGAGRTASESAAEVLDRPDRRRAPPPARWSSRRGEDQRGYRQRSRVAVCADVGSTFTKVAVVDLDTGALLATAAQPTTVDTDVLHGLDAAVAAATAARYPDRHVDGVRLLVGRRRAAARGRRVRAAGDGRGRPPGRPLAPARGWSTSRPAGSTAPASRALTAAGPTWCCWSAAPTAATRRCCGTTRPALAAARLRVPVVVAGNVEVRDEALASAPARGRGGDRQRAAAHRRAEPRPARAAIREVFLRHVIGGKRLSRGPRFASLVRGATPDVVLTAVELLADHLGGDLLVVDVGGATTDVYSVLQPRPGRAGRDVAGTLWRSRTVEGDLGLRWSAPRCSPPRSRNAC